MKNIVHGGKLLRYSAGPLGRFISSKIKAYREPTRKGTARGNPIGFPANKYEASLLLLTSETAQNIAKRLGTSYDLIRKWKAEKPFKNQVDRHIREFSEFLVDVLVKEWDDVLRHDPDIGKILLNWFPDSLTDTSSERELLPKAMAELAQDFFPSERLKDGIFAAMGAKAKKRWDLIMPFLQVLDFWDLEGARGKGELQRILVEIFSRRIKFMWGLAGVFFDDLESLLKKRIINKKDRNEAISIVKTLTFCVGKLYAMTHWTG